MSFFLIVRLIQFNISFHFNIRLVGVSCKWILKCLHWVCKQSNSIKKLFWLKCGEELSYFSSWNVFFTCSFKGGQLWVFISVIIPAVCMLSVGEDVLIDIWGTISWTGGRMNGIVSLLKLSSDFSHWRNWRCVPWMSFDFCNCHSVSRLILKHPVNEVIPLIWVRFFSVFEGFNVLFPKMITFSSGHIFVIRIWRFCLMETRPTNHHNVQNNACCKQVDFYSNILLSFMNLWSHISLCSFSRHIRLLIRSKSKVC